MRNIIDGNSLLFRAFYGVRQRLTRPDGTPVNAVYGFCNMILPLIAEAKAEDEFICVFDSARKNWRNDIYPEYKGNRDAPPQDLIAQIDIVRDAVRAMGIPCLIVPGVEADDVIGTLAQKQCPTRIISSDKDLMQLVSDCIFIYDSMKNQEIRAPEVFDKFGVRPDQMNDCQALIGDSSDNVPGVYGIGPKAAAALIAEYGTIENIYENIDKIANDRIKRLLQEGKNSAFMSKKLVTLKTDVEIPPYMPYKFDPETAREFFMTHVGSQTLAEKARKIQAVTPMPADKLPEDIFVFRMDDYIGGAAVKSVWDKLIDKNIRKIAYDWKAIFHNLDDMGFDVSQITPIEDTMLMNYACNYAGSGNVFEDYNYFKAHPSKIYETDMAILRPLFAMEKNGILVDRTKLKEISELLHKQADELQDKIWMLSGSRFNIASPKQLAEILFDKMHLPTDKSRSTGADKLEALADGNEIIGLVLNWRTLTKLAGTYADALPHSVAGDGRIHTTFLQTSTNTGRLSSQNPNLQNIPIKSDIGGQIRKCFVAAPGNVLISADYSQIQLRILAHIADVKLLKDAFVGGKDIHSETAIRIFGIVTPENRRIAKTMNFSIIYGISPFGLSAQLGVSRAEASKMIDDYMATMPEVKKYIEDTKKFVTEHGYVDTYLGRRIIFPDVNNPRQRNYALRAAVNAPIQGTEADIMRLALAKLAELPVKMVLQIHDEFVFEAPAEAAEKYAKEIEKIMENIVTLSVPITADYSISDRWEK